MSPFTKLDGMYFNKEREPDEFRAEFMKDVEKALDDEDVEYIGFNCTNKIDFYNLMDMLEGINRKVTAYGTSKDEYAIVIDNSKMRDSSEDDDPDEPDDSDLSEE